MTLKARIDALAIRASAEIKALRILINGNAANLNNLTTTNKTDLVAAINEVNAKQTATIYRSGRELVAATTMTTVAQVAATLRAFPIWILKPVTLTAVRSEVTTLLAGATYRMGLYTDNGNAYPDTLVNGSDLGTNDAATTGVKTQTFASPITLTPGLYWVVINNSGTPTLRGIAVSALPNVLGVNPAGGASPFYTTWSIAQTYGPLPTNFPGSAALAANVAAPLAMFRIQ